jgi:hypothetical protein
MLAHAREIPSTVINKLLIRKALLFLKMYSEKKKRLKLIITYKHVFHRQKHRKRNVRSTSGERTQDTREIILQQKSFLSTGKNLFLKHKPRKKVLIAEKQNAGYYKQTLL